MFNLHVWHASSRSVFVRFCSDTKRYISKAFYLNIFREFFGQTTSSCWSWCWILISIKPLGGPRLVLHNFTYLLPSRNHWRIRRILQGCQRYIGKKFQFLSLSLCVCVYVCLDVLKEVITACLSMLISWSSTGSCGVGIVKRQETFATRALVYSGSISWYSESALVKLFSIFPIPLHWKTCKKSCLFTHSGWKVGSHCLKLNYKFWPIR